MNKKTETRKEFLKRFGFKIRGEEVINKEVDVLTLSKEQADFLKEYSIWLEQFNTYIKKRNTAPFDIENNKRLMELSAEAEKRKASLELHMNNELFSTAFNTVTQQISNSITIQIQF